MARFAGFSKYDQDMIVPCRELPAWPLGLEVYYSFSEELLVRVWRPSITFIFE